MMEKMKKKSNNNNNTWDGETYIYKGGKVNPKIKLKIKHIIIVCDCVTRIASQAFEDCQSLISIQFIESSSPSLPNSNNNDSSLSSSSSSSLLKIIGNRAFSRCQSLQRIIGPFPTSIERIEKNAFLNCTNLSSIGFQSSSSIMLIDKEAFRGCKSLTAIKFPTSLKVLGTKAFASCTGLRSVEFVNNCKIAKLPKDIFYECVSLKKVVLSDRIKSIGEAAFMDCTALTSIDLPNSLEYIKDFVFAICESLQSIKIPPHVKEIGMGAFCLTGLQSIELRCPYIQTIREYMFYGCSSLNCVELPSSLRRIENDTFSSCTNLKSVYFDTSTTKNKLPDDEEDDECGKYDTNFYSRQGSGKTTIISLPNTIQHISIEAFDMCDQLGELIDWKTICSICNRNKLRRFLQCSDHCPAAIRPYILCQRFSSYHDEWKNNASKANRKKEQVVTREDMFHTFLHTNSIYYLLLRDGSIWEQQQKF